jgi:hypothetical protein
MTSAEPTAEPTASAAASPSPADNGQDPHPPLPPPGGGGASGGFDLPFGPVGGGLLLAGAVIAVIALLFFFPFSPLGRKRQPGSARFYYARMLFWSRLLKAGPAPHQTPYEYSEALAREVQGTGLYARTIARAYVRERFGRDPLETGERRSLGLAYHSLRTRLWRSMPGRQLRRVLRGARTRARR